MKKKEKCQRLCHIVVCEKGGVGKSFIASLVANFSKSARNGVKALDTDSNTPTMMKYKAFDPSHVDYKDENGDIDKSKFDKIIDYVEDAAKKGVDCVIDTGSNSIDVLPSYIRSNEIFEMLVEMNIQPVIHLVIAGGKEEDACYQSARRMMDGFGAAPYYMIWMNDYFGAVKRSIPEIAKGFDAQFLGSVHLPKLDQSYHEDLDKKQVLGLTFEEAISDDKEFPSRVQKRRMGILQKAVFDQLGEKIGSLEEIEVTE